MALTEGMRLGVYEVGAILGRGGMGEVYQARDTKLRRDVALKVLPEAFAMDADRLARFEREAQVLASLNHPHIAAIYGVEESGPTKALVLELVEGPTLADRIAQGPIALAEARLIARQIALALGAAHDQGIIHRDLKPANIKIRSDGTVKVLDFGLAKALPFPNADGDRAQGPTITGPWLTEAGVLLGTTAYMSPELITGQPADRRSDIWAFGCVLYEMLSGRRAFAGNHTAEIVGALMQLEPDWRALPAAAPAMQSVLKRCLQKDPSLRMRDITDARFQLDEGFDASFAPGQATPRPGARARWAGWVVAAIAVAAAGTMLITSRPPLVDPPETRLEIVTPPAADPLSLAMAPDGRSVVFQAGQQPPRLWLRPLSSQEAEPLPGTDGATMPFWSPDSQSIGFFVGGLVKRLDLESKFVRTLGSVTAAVGGAWRQDGTILIGNGLGPLNVLPANGGDVKPATSLLPEQTNHRWPQLLPDGERFLLFATGAPDVRGLYLGSLSNTTLYRVVDRELAYALLAPANVLFARQGALWTRRLNREYTAAEDELRPVAPKVLVHGYLVGFGAFSASATGSIAFRSSAKSTQLTWIGRTGATAGVAGQPDDSQLTLRDLSSDEQSVLVERNVNGNRDVWLIHLDRGVPRRLSFHDGDDGYPIFSLDGSRVVHATGGHREFFDIQERRSDGTGAERLLLASRDDYNQPQDWSSDGQYILYRVQTAGGADLRALPVTGDNKPLDVTHTPFSEGAARFSPNGRWVAYESNETGRNEIWVQPFPEAGPRSQLSVGGGTGPRWRRNGRELYYVASDQRLMVISVTTDGARLQASSAAALFTLPPVFGGYEPSSDGQRFLVNKVVAEASPITVILNWRPAR